MSRPQSIRITSCSIVVMPVDIWTRRLPSPSSLQVVLQGIHKKPIRKSDGTYLFLDLPPGSYSLEVTSHAYIPYHQLIETAQLNKLNPVVTVPLLPGPGYAYPAAATAISLPLVDSGGNSCACAEVDAYIHDDGAARGRLAQDMLKAGECLAAIGLPQGRTAAGESLLLRGQGQEELVRVAEVLPGGMLRFEEPVRGSYRRGTFFLPAVRTRSMNNGTALLPFRGILPKTFTVKASIRFGQLRAEAELSGEAGQVTTSKPFTIDTSREK